MKFVKMIIVIYWIVVLQSFQQILIGLESILETILLWFSHKINWLILKHWDVRITPSTKTKPVFTITLTRMASIFQGPRGSLVKNKMAQNNCFVYSLLDDYCTKLVKSLFCPIDLSTYIFIDSAAALLLVLSILADFLKSLIIFWYCVASRQKCHYFKRIIC